MNYSEITHTPTSGHAVGNAKIDENNPTTCSARHSTGEGRMNNLQIAVCVIAIAVAQALMLLLILSRERDIKELRELVNELREVVY
jgi:hypothetical protein